ncbi:hypothetical protein NZK35_33080 [Stieleria sp. ICT_E10.1]|nr:hypothetical protein [Stieleria sedimenti]
MIVTVSRSSEGKKADWRIDDGVDDRPRCGAIGVGTAFDVEDVIVIDGGHLHDSSNLQWQNGGVDRAAANQH